MSAAGDLLNEALRHHRNGALDAAAHHYRAALADRAADGDALNLYGALLYQAGRSEAGRLMMSRAVACAPNLAGAHANLGAAWREAGRFDRALASCRLAVTLNPTLPAAWNTLGSLPQPLGGPDKAAWLYRRAVVLDPAYAEAHANLAAALMTMRRRDADAAFRVALALAPAFTGGLGGYARFLHEGGDGVAALLYRRATELAPSDPEIRNNRGTLLYAQGERAGGAALHRQALVLRPDYAAACNNIGNGLKDDGRISASAAWYRRALRLVPGATTARCNLALALQDFGELDESESLMREALAETPDDLKTHSNLIMAMHYSERWGADEILAEARRFAGVAERGGARVGLANEADPGKVLRVGYVSGDFRMHPVGFFFDKVIGAHSTSRIEAVCYDDGAASDEMTEALRAKARIWRPIAGRGDDEVEAMIRRDRIDILVDLAGHTGKNRLPLFARRPAPVQVSWLGYFGTTGLSAIDYVLADSIVLPEGDERFFSETPVRLPGCYLCYSPHRLEVPTGPFPALAGGGVTFGSFNNRAKLTASTLSLWAEILRRTPRSRLFLKTKSLADPAVRVDLAGRFDALGIAEYRLILEGHSPLADAMAAYNRVDIALDPFPFGGCTTTAETLWMGVPLVTLRGERWAGRMSESILRTIGLGQWVAGDRAAYADLACSLADDLSSLAELRRSLRQRLVGSSFCDGALFGARLEEAYRSMWMRWCEQKS